VKVYEDVIILGVGIVNAIEERRGMPFK